jgi:hypothetical protein
VATYAYLRASTERQDVTNHRRGTLEYANTRGLGPPSPRFLVEAVGIAGNHGEYAPKDAGPASFLGRHGRSAVS